MTFCEREQEKGSESVMPKEKDVEESGIVWPKDVKGERSTTAAGKEIWARLSSYFS